MKIKVVLFIFFLIIKLVFSLKTKFLYRMSKKLNQLPLCLRDELPKRFKKIKNASYKENDLDFPLHLYLQDNDIQIQQEGSDIVKFLKGKCILVTGGTGFLGKILIEKLLRSCEDITLYVLVRNKKGMTTETRTKEMLESYVFKRLAKINPSFRKNLVGISGDVSKPDLELSIEDRKMLTEKVNIIYNVAATTRFDEPLLKAANCNVFGTIEIVKLAKECQNFEVLTHVSTAFSNCDRKEIREEFYEPRLNVNQLIILLKNFDHTFIEKITPSLLGSLPNTYTLTKQITEDYIKNEAKGIAACICRPAIVTSSSKEPCFGWSDNQLGPTGIFMAVCAGLLHVQRAEGSYIAELVPSDFVINHCIAASYKTAKERNLEKVKIYNYVSSSQNPQTWRSMVKGTKYIDNVGLKISVMRPFLIMTRNDFLLKIGYFLFHMVPAYLIDFTLILSGQKPQIRNAYKKLIKFCAVIEFFSTSNFKFDNANTQMLWKDLNHVDKKNFNFDITSICWPRYYSNMFFGLKEFLFKESIEDTLDTGRSRSKRLLYIQNSIVVLVAVLLLMFIYSCYNYLCVIIPEKLTPK